jgi:tetratricopeptide (TPR) repeat protein
VESALALAPEDAAVLYHAGALYRQGLQVPSSYARRRARSLFEKAAKLCKGAPPDAAAESTPALPVDLELARLAYEDEQTLAALELLGGIQSRHPGHAPALRLELGIFEERGWAAEAADAARRLEARCPRAIEPQLHFARAAASRGAIGEAAARYEEAYSRDQRRTDVLDELVEIDVRRGKLDAARARLERWLAAHPDDRRARSHLARLLLDGDLGSEALALLEQSAAERPRDPRAWRELAQAHERLGRGPDARRAYQRVLEIEPGDLAVRAYLHHLEGRPQDRFWEAHDEALEDWIDKLPEASRHPNAGSLAVLDIAVLRLYPDGSSSEYTHQAHLLFNDSDKDARAQVETQGEIRLLRTRTPDGRFLEPVAATGRRQFVMPGLEPGAIVEFAYLREESRFSGWLFGKAPFFFQDHSYREPMLLSRYVLLLPPGLDVSLLERSLSGSAAAGDGSGLARVARTETALPDGGRAIVYEARDVPRIEPERPMPPREDYLPNVALVERAGWDEVARALAQPAAGRDRVTPLLASWASEATLGIAEPAAKVHALYRKVNEWVTAERGPADAQGILLEKAGDRNVLLKALLEAAGITASWAFVRSRDGLEPTRGLEHPQPGLFDERLLHVEIAGGDSLWLTLDARHAPLGKLPAEWQGSPALVLRPGGADLFEVPQADPETLGESAEVSISLKADGSAAVRVKTTSRSFGAYIQKPAFEALDAQRRRNSLSRFGAALFPGARVRRVELPDLERLGAPLCIEMELEAPRLLQSSGAESLLRSVYPPLQLVNSAIGLARRVHPYHMGAPAFRSDRVRIELGERLRLARVPPSTALFGPLGSYSLRFEPQGSVIGIERRLILRGGLLTAAEFPRLAEFAREVDEAESGRIVLESAAE